MRTEITTEHDVIGRWVDSRGERSAAVEGTEDKEGKGLLGVAFAHGEKSQDIEWDQ